MRISILHYTILLVFFFSGCKEKDTEIIPISIPNPAKVLEGRWNIIQTKAVGNVKVQGQNVPVEGTNSTPPTGFYDMVVGDKENTYQYDIKTLLQLRFGERGISTIDYDYDDKDAGTWVITSDQQLIFYANQGNVQDIFFTQYDSAGLEILQLSLPIDTTLEGFKYEGKIMVDMIKSK